MQEKTKGVRKRLHYGWIIFGCCFVMVMVALGFCSTPFSLYLPVVTEQLSIPRSIFSLTNSFRFAVVAIMNLLFGALITRISPRRMTAFGFLSLIGAMLLFSFAKSIVLFYIGGCLLGLGLAWTTTTMVGYYVEKWFSKAKGTIMGVILAANGIGGAIAGQVLTPYIYSASTDGWRVSYRLTALLLLIVGAVVVLLLRNDPMDKGLQPMGADAEAKAKRGSDWEGISAKEAFASPSTYFAMFCVFLIGMALNGCTGTASAYMRDLGFDPQVIANVVSIHSLALAASKMLVGVGYDRLGLRVTMLICSGFAVLCFLTLVLMETAGSASAYVYAVLSSLGLPLETVMLPLIASFMFGRKDYAKMMGIFVSVNTFGYLVATPAINLVFDKLGSYRSAYIASIFIMLFAAAGMQLVLAAAQKRQRAGAEGLLGRADPQKPLGTER